MRDDPNTSVYFEDGPRVANLPDTLADLLERLGGIPAARVFLDPPPGTVTFEHFERIDGRLGEWRCELVSNTLVRRTASMAQGVVQATVGTKIMNFVEPERLGVCAMAAPHLMVNGNVRRPAFSFVAYADIPDRAMLRQNAPPLPPTLAVDTFVAGNTEAEFRMKHDECFASGCRLAWVLFPDTRLLRVHAHPGNADRFTQLTADDTLDGGDVLPGFSVRVGDLFDV